MATYVLVHGSWGSAWHWHRVRPLLEAQGHRVLTPTLLGLGERADHASEDVGLGAHIDDVVGLLDEEGLADAVLVGHSYGGMVVTGVAARSAGRVDQVVYVDAFAPDPGQSAFDILPWLVDAFSADVDAERPWAIPPMDFAALGVEDPADLAELTARATAMPRLTHEEPLPTDERDVLQAMKATYVWCTRQPLFADVAAAMRTRQIETVELDTGHYPMLSDPKSMVRLLLACADSEEKS